MPVTLGIARGRIEIQTADIAAARVVIEREAKLMGKSFDEAGKKADAAAKTAAKGWKSLGGLGQNLGLSLVGAGFVALSARTAASLEQLRIRFEAIAGSQAKGDKLMASIAKRARELNQPVREVQEAFAGIVPFIKGGQKELDRYVGLVSRLATLNPREGAAGAVFAIREALSSGGRDLVSLSERFNLPRKELRKLIEDTGDFGTALDVILTKFGATENVAKKLGNTFGTSLSVFLSEGEQLLSAVLTPVLQALTPIVKHATAFVRVLQEGSPAILGLAGGFITLAAAIGPVTFGLNKVIDGLRLVKQLSGTKFGKVAVGVGAAAGGAELGIAGVRLAGSLGIGGFGQFKGKSQDEARDMIGETAKQIIVVLANAFLDGAKLIAIGMAQVDKAIKFVGAVFEMGGLAIQDIIGQIVTGIGEFLGSTGLKAFTQTSIDMIQSGSEMRRDVETRRYGVADRIAKGITLTPDEIAQIDMAAASVKKDVLGVLVDFLFPKPEEVKEEVEGGAGGSTGIGSDELAAFQDYKDDVAKIETDAQQDRLEATEEYEAKKTETEADYQRERAETVADEAKRRRRDEEKLARDITDARKEGVDREAETIRDRDEKITEIREETQQQELRKIEDYHRERLKAERDHRENLLEAASRLDARAVFEELRSFRNKTRDAGENHRTEIRRDRENAQERIEQETEESTSRLEEIRRGIEERITELQSSAEIERRQREEDFQEKLARFDAEHVREMGKLDQQHRDRINEINQNAIDEKTARKTQWTNEVLELGGHGARMLQIQRANHAAMEAEYMQFLAREAAARQQAAGINQPTGVLTTTNIYRMQSDLQPSRTLPPPIIRGGSKAGIAFQSGTSNVPFSGLFGLHQGEVVARPDVSRIIRSVLGPDFTQPQLAAAVARGAHGGLSIPVTITALPGMSPHDIAQLVAAEVEPAVQRIMDGDR